MFFQKILNYINFIKENFITTHHYPSKAHGKKLLEIFGTKKL